MNWKLIRVIDTFVGIPLIRLLSFLVPGGRNRRPQRPAAPPKKILLIKFWGIGNIFMMLPSIQAISDAFPGAEIDFLTLETNREALRSLGIAKRVSAIDTRSTMRFFRSWRASVQELRAARYDLAIDFDQFARFSALMTFQIRTRWTIGFSTRGQHRHHLYAETVDYDDHLHVSRSFYTLVTPLVNSPYSAAIRCIDRDALRKEGGRLLREKGIDERVLVVVMHIGTSHNFKERRWAPERYAGLADRLVEQFGLRIVLTGLPDERLLIAEAKEHLRHREHVLDLGGQLTFRDYVALIAIADLVISADTATVHIASAVNTPAVGFYGPNTPRLYGPWRENGFALDAEFTCSPCITNFNGKIHTCRHPDGRGACMNSISVEAAFKAIEDRYLRSGAPWQLSKLKGAPA